MTGRRVAITGIGLVCPLGFDAGTVFDTLLAGKSAIRHLDLESPAGRFETVGAMVPGETWTEVPRPFRLTSDRLSLYALNAADAAVLDAGLDMELENRDRIGIAVGTSLGGAASQEAAYAEVFQKNAKRLAPFTLVKVMYNGPAAQIALRYGLGGPNVTYTTTCSSSTVSIGESIRQIRHGYADVMLAGGAEALFAYVSIKAWLALQVLAPERTDNPSATCRPFHRDRKGTVLGDGAAFVVLEDWDHAVKRGARIYAEAAGFGLCNDPSHMTQPSPMSQGRAMRAALADAAVNIDEVDYINAHGTGTRLNDASESAAIRDVFAQHTLQVPVSSTKSMHGHLVGAAGALEFIISTLAISRQQLPPTANLDDIDPECELNHVAMLGRDAVVRTVLSNSFAVGGTAGALIVRAAG